MAAKTMVVCDLCGRELPRHVEEVGLDGTKVMLWDNSRPEDFDARRFFKHLCPQCKDRIDRFVTYMFDKNKKRAELIAERKVINERRRNELKSKG